MMQIDCHCLRCGHSWAKKIEGRPARCPNCSQTKWDTVARKPAGASADARRRGKK